MTTGMTNIAVNPIAAAKCMKRRQLLDAIDEVLNDWGLVDELLDNWGLVDELLDDWGLGRSREVTTGIAANPIAAAKCMKRRHLLHFLDEVLDEGQYPFDSAMSNAQAVLKHMERIRIASCSRMSGRTKTILAILEVSLGYWDEELIMELEYPGDIIQEAKILPDRRVAGVPVQKDRRGTYVKPVREPVEHDPRAF